MSLPSRPSLPPGRWLGPWKQPLPWVSLVLLLLCLRTEPPRLWFWLTLLLISLAVGLLQSLSRRS
ncbi:MAG: hypothetical protein ACKOZT_07235 [Cyanobium sp.]